MDHLPRAFSASILSTGIVFALVAGAVAQSRIVRPQPNGNSARRQHIATLHASDSAEGSRITLSADQSLNDYEAYRRGDRFYVKIPAADVPRVEALRGRGFADVTAQRSGGSTILSFRLLPGATAHVEQRGNRLDLVISVPGGGTPSVASNRTRDLSRPNNAGNSVSDFNRRNSGIPTSNRNPAKKNASNSSASAKINPATSSSNSNRNSKTGSNRGASANSKTAPTPKPTPAPKSTPSPKSTPTPAPSPSAKPTATAKPTVTPSSKLTTTNSNSSSSPAGPIAASPDWWSRMKERGHYWLLLAQLNPLPVAVGAALLLLMITALLFQRRRARATRRVRRTRAKVKKESVSSSTTADLAAPIVASEAGAVAAGISEAGADHETESVTAVPDQAISSVPSAVDDGRRERVSRVADEARKVFAGETYDENIVGSEDRETRHLVGAELLSGLVSRDVGRRARAREAFMKHGYFDDATRDLRVAESANERAAAARRLSFVRDREATPHLIGALSDSSPDVRRAAIEALMDLRDPAAIAPLNSLIQTERDRRVPQHLIKHAIDACATAEPAEETMVPHYTDAPQAASQEPETEREVIEI